MGHDRNKGERPPKVFSNFHGQHEYDRYFYLRIGEIVEVDIDHYRMKIKWHSGAGSPNWMPISFPYVGPAGCMGAMPEEGAFGIFGFYDEGTGKGSPLPLMYIPASLVAATGYNVTKKNPDAISTEDKNLIFRRFRKLYDGDMIMASSFGGQVFVNKDIEIADSNMDSIVIRQSDQSFIATSVNNYVFADGVMVNAGPIVRNGLVLFDSKGNRLPDMTAREITLSDGRNAIYMIPYGEKIDYDTQYYSEYHISVDDLVDGKKDFNDINSTSTISSRSPIVTMAFGNYVGSRIQDKIYGKILKPAINFPTETNDPGSFSLVQCVQNKGADEVANLGLAYALHFHRSGSFLGVDKEGQLFVFLSASMANSSGNGRSMSLLAQGGRKESWGLDTDGVSWDYATKGSVTWDIGSGGPKTENKSFVLNTEKSICLQAGGEDDDGYARQDITNGNQNIKVGGDKIEKITGASSTSIDGLKSENVFGAATFDCQASYSVNVMGTFKETAINDKQCQFGKRKTTINGNDELILNKGDLTETLQIFGNRKTTMLGPGSIEESILTGNRKINIKAGKFEVAVTAGGVEIKALAGNVKMTGLTAEVSGKVSASVKGIQVKLGNAAIGGVITSISHKDYICGVPLKCSTTVKAGP